jgi:hypothetical protein
MSKSDKTSDRRKLGWLAAGMLSLLLSSSAWGLDLDHEIVRQETDSAQILNTLGRDKSVNQATSTETNSKVQVKLLRAPKARKRS